MHNIKFIQADLAEVLVQKIGFPDIYQRAIEVGQAQHGDVSSLNAER